MWGFHPDFRTAIFVFLQAETGILLAFLMLRLLWLSPGFSGFESQPTNYSLWHTVACHQGFAVGHELLFSNLVNSRTGQLLLVQNALLEG